MGPFLRKNHLLSLGEFSFLLNWTGVSYIISIAKNIFKNIGALVRSLSFFLLRLLCVSIKLPYGLAWNTVVMPVLVLLAATWKC